MKKEIEIDMEQIEEKEWAMRMLFRLYAIKKMIGHASIRSTLHYVKNGDEVWARIQKSIDTEADRLLRDDVL